MTVNHSVGGSNPSLPANPINWNIMIYLNLIVMMINLYFVWNLNPKKSDCESFVFWLNSAGLVGNAFAIINRL